MSDDPETVSGWVVSYLLYTDMDPRQPYAAGEVVVDAPDPDAAEDLGVDRVIDADPLFDERLHPVVLVHSVDPTDEPPGRPTSRGL